MLAVTKHSIRRILNRVRGVVVLMAIVHVIGGLLFSWIEDHDWLTGQYWATVSGFTVGYGDFSPKTGPGMIITMVYIPTMWLLCIFMSAHIISVVMEDKNLFSNAEQERNEAFYLELGQFFGIIPKHFSSLPPLSWWIKQHHFTANTPSDEDEPTS